MTVYIIDGYNVLHELRRYQGKEAHGARLDPGALADERARLVDRIASLMGGTADRALIVFDSHTATLQKVESATPTVEVYFGSLQRSADAIIERAAYVLRAAENVVVVTSDYGLQKTVFTASVMRQSSRQFVNELQAHTRKVANSTDCTTIVHRVEERIDATSLERLKSLRDCLAEEETDRG
jgi:predicted RNA-binding protein with PIN domain